MLGFVAFKTEVIARLGNRTDIDSRVERWINYAFFELLLSPRFNYHELDRTHTFGTVANTSGYTMPIDLWHVLDIRDMTNQQKLFRTHWQVIDKTTQVTSQPSRYFRFGNQLFLDPIPNAFFQMRVRYRTRPGDLTAGSAFEGLGTEWEEIFMTLAVAKGFEALDQREKAAECRALVETRIQMQEDVAKLEDADAETTIAPAIRFRQ